MQIDPGVLTLAMAVSPAWRHVRLDVSRRSEGRRLPTRRALVVAADGTGDFNTVQGAIDFVPDRSPRRVTIFIRNGSYEEIVYFRNKSNITLVGEDRDKVVDLLRATTRSSIRIRRTSARTSGRARSRRAAQRSWATTPPGFIS